MNSTKTRILRGNTRQEITGIVVNSHMQAPRPYRRKIRQEMYFINKYGLDSHLVEINEMRSNYLQHLIGKIQFVLFVNPKDKEMFEYLGQIKEFIRG